MAKLNIKTVTWYGILGLFIAVAFLPMLKAFAPEYFPGSPGSPGSPSVSGFRDLDCSGVTCGEGQFCQKNQCLNVATRYPNAVPAGNE